MKKPLANRKSVKKHSLASQQVKYSRKFARLVAKRAFKESR